MQLSVGALVGGRYTVTARLTAESETGLYQGRDEQTGDPVVVRWLPPARAARAGPSFQRRYDRLGPRLEKLGHRCLGRYLAHGRDRDGSLFVVSTLPEGELASTRLAKRPEWDLAGALRILRDGAAGLAQLHSRGLVHGAVDPGNLFIPRDPALPCVLVFDIACVDLTDLAFLGDDPTLDGGPDSGAGLLASAPLPTPADDLVALGKIALAWLFGEAALQDPRPDRLLRESAGTATDEMQLLHSVLAAVFSSDASNRLADAAELRSFLEGSQPVHPTAQTVGSSIIAALGAAHHVEPTVAGGPPAPGPASSAEPGAAFLGTILEGRYVLESLLGRGGMGVVYRARHLVLGTPRAVKLVRGFQSRSSYVQRFLKEAQLASRVQHPNTVFLSDFGIGPDGQPFLVMELVGGRTLRQFLVTDSVSIERACRIATQIALGMQAIHDKGIVHRDLKPDNIFIIAEDGIRDFVKIADFGLAKELIPDEPGSSSQATPADGRAADAPPDGQGLHSLPTPPLQTPPETQASESDQTAAGALVGTPRYMSPEQARGLAVDARADQYALGCILYELLTGAPPFTEPQLVKLLALHISAQPAAPHLKAPSRAIPPSLSALTMRLLAKAPGERFASMREVAEALERAASPPAPSTAVLPRPSRPRRRVVAVAMAGVTLACTIAGGVVWQRRSARLGSASELSQSEVEPLKQQSLRTIDEVLSRADAETLVRDLSTLSEARSSEVAARLLPLLNDPRMTVRAEAARVAGTTGERTLLGPLRGLLSTREPAAVRLATAEALDLIGDADGTAALRAWMTHGSSVAAQVQAALRLCLRGDEEALRVLRHGLTLPTGEAGDAEPLPPVTRLRILSCLAGNGDAAARALLQTQASEAGTVPQKLAAAAQLLELGDPAGPQALRRELGSSGPYRLAAARLLASPSEPEAVALCRQVVEGGPAGTSALSLALLGLAAGGDPADARRAASWQRPEAGSEVRIAAAVATLRLLTSATTLLANESLRWARLALSDPSWQVRVAAAEILGDVSSPDALTVLARLSRDEVVAVRRAAVRALSAHPSQAALELLRERVRDSAPEVRWDALSMLGRLVTELRRLGSSSLAVSGLDLLREVAAQTAGAEPALAAAVLVRIGERTLDAALQATLRSAPAAIRRLVLDELQALPGWLGKALSDSDFEVRFAAAERLAERGDAQALPVLREAASRGGWVSVVANVLRVRLGDAGAAVAEARYGPAAPLLSRLAVLSVLTGSVDELEALSQAAHDPAAEVRRLVALRAAAVKGGAALLQALRGDPEPVVRAQAQALLGRGPRAPEPSFELRSRSIAERLRVPAAPPPVAASVPDLGAPPAEPPPVETPTGAVESGFLKVEAPPGLLFRLDDGPWSLPGSAPLALPAGEHRLSTVEGLQTVAIAGGATSLVKLTASRGEQALSSAAALIKQGRYLQARRSLELAEAQCQVQVQGGGKAPSKPGCRALLLSVAFQRAQLWEAQRLLPEAMNEYQRIVAPTAKSDEVPAQRAAAVQAAARLSRQLGRVLSAERRGSRCVVDSFWVEPGRKTLVVKGVRTTVTVKAGETVGSGECS